MIRNYLKIAWRNLIKNKVSSFINIGGLAVGMAVAMLIGLWIWDELSFNKYHQNYDRIAQIMVNANYTGEVYTINSNPLPMGYELRSAYAADFKYVVMSTGAEQHNLVLKDKSFTETGRYMEPDVTQMLTLRMLYGSASGLTDQNSILLDQSLSKKLFGDADPVGQVLKIDNKLNVKVTGVYEDVPNNSDFKDLGFIAPFDLYLASNPWAKDARNNWKNQFVQIYTQLNQGKDFSQVSAQIKDIKLRNVSGDQAARKPVVFLQPMSKWHLYSTFKNGVNITSEQLKFIWFYGIIGVFVLLLACINFMNLSTARSEKRSKEVGIRKAIGSLRQQLIGQFFSESILIALVAFVVALALVQYSLPFFNQIADKKIAILWANPLFWCSGIAFAMLTGILAGIYPALYLSSFDPVTVLKGTFGIGRLAALPRKAMVVVQFTVSITLIIGTIVVYRQVQHGQDRPVGYSREGLVSLSISSSELKSKYNVISTELKNTGAVTSIAASANPLTSIWSTDNQFEWPGKDPSLKVDFGAIAVNYDYGKTIGWQFTDGRDFSSAFPSDSGGYVINQAAVKQMGLQHPVGTVIKHGDKYFRIIGVINDMVMESPFAQTTPSFFFLQGDPSFLLIRINPKLSEHNALTKISRVLKNLLPNETLDYKFVDETYSAKFAAEERIGKLSGGFAVLAIFISCLGLFAMAAYVAERRIKEIGVRKVLGATVFNLWGMLSGDFVVLVLISFLVAIPVAYYGMHSWLQNYTYRTELSWWIFAVTGIGSILITLLTVSYQTIRAAFANPVKSLKTE